MSNSTSPHQQFHSREQATLWLEKHAQLSPRVRSALRYALPTPAELEVLRTAQAEYLAGHKSDRAAAKDPQVTYTTEDRQTYQRALYEHYQAVRALLRTQAPQPKEPADHVRP